MATLLTLVNNVADEVGLARPASLIGSTNTTAKRILSQAQRAGKHLAKKDWSILLKRQIFTTASSAEAYALPNDFDHFVDNTHWNLSNQDPMNGPISRQRWQANKSGLVTITVNDRFQIRADGNENRYFIDPVPTSAENVSFYYITKSWCRSHGGQRQSEWKADNDVLLLDDFVYELELKWRLLRAFGHSFSSEQAEAFVECNRAFARDGGMPTLSITQPPIDRRFDANIPDTGFG